MVIMESMKFPAVGKIHYRGKLVTPRLAYLLEVQEEFREREIRDRLNSSSRGHEIGADNANGEAAGWSFTRLLMSPKLMTAAAAAFCFFLPARQAPFAAMQNNFLSVARAATGALASVPSVSTETTGVSTVSILPRLAIHLLGKP